MLWFTLLLNTYYERVKGLAMKKFNSLQFIFGITDHQLYSA